MKKFKILSIVLLGVLFITSPADLNAQKAKTTKKSTGKSGVLVKTKKSKEAESAYQYYLDGKRVYGDSLSKIYGGALGNYNDAKGILRGGNWSYSGAPNTWIKGSTNISPSVPYTSAGAYNLAVPFSELGGNSNRLTMNKELRDNDSFSRKSNFELDKDQRSFNLSMEAACQEGEIKFSIFSPNKKLFKELVVNEGETRSWSKSFPIHSLPDEDTRDLYGKWVLQIEVEKAIGRYYISAMSK